VSERRRRWREIALMERGSLESRIVWACVLVLAAFMMLSTAIAQTAAIVMIFALAVDVVRRRGLGGGRSPLMLPLVILLLIRLFAVLASTNVSTSLPALWKEIPFYLVVIAVVRLWDPVREDRLVLFLRVAFGAAAIVAVIGSFRYVLGFDHRASSITSSYYTFGMYLTAVFALALPFGNNRTIFPIRWIWVGGVIVILAGILLSMNRIHWVVAGCLILGVGVWRERGLLAVAVVTGGVLLVLVPSLMDRFDQLLAMRENLSDRDVIWRGAVAMGSDHPFTGWGVRTFHEVFPYMNEIGDKRVGSWHNDLLQLYMESGILAVGAYVWLLTAAVAAGVRTWRRSSGSEVLRTFSLGGVMAVLSFAVAGLTGVFISDPVAGVFLRVLLGMVGALSAFDEAPAHEGHVISS